MSENPNGGVNPDTLEIEVEGEKLTFRFVASIDIPQGATVNMQIGADLTEVPDEGLWLLSNLVTKEQIRRLRSKQNMELDPAKNSDVWAEDAPEWSPPPTQDEIPKQRSIEEVVAVHFERLPSWNFNAFEDEEDFDDDEWGDE
jgi:hypothetical protein